MNKTQKRNTGRVHTYLKTPKELSISWNTDECKFGVPFHYIPCEFYFHMSWRVFVPQRVFQCGDLCITVANV